MFASPEAMVKQANNRRLSFPHSLRGEGPRRREEEAGTRAQPPFALAVPKIPGTGVQKQFSF